MGWTTVIINGLIVMLGLLMISLGYDIDKEQKESFIMLYVLMTSDGLKNHAGKANQDYKVLQRITIVFCSYHRSINCC